MPQVCETLDDPENGQVNVSNGAVTGAMATYACDEGFILDGPETRVCDDEGRWSGSEPECRRTYTSPRDSYMSWTCSTIS